MSRLSSRACRLTASLITALALAPASASAAAAEAALVKRINASTHTASVSQVVELGGALYFAAERNHSYPSVYPTELYRSDGTLAGTTLVFDSIDPISSLRVIDGQLAFRGNTVSGDPKTYVSDGTPAGTVVAGERLTAAGLAAVATADGSLYTASTYVPPGSSGGSLVKRAPGSSDPLEALPGVQVFDLAALGDKVYVAGALTTGPFDERSGIWVTDGTPGGTTRLARPAGATYTSPQSLTATTDAVYFVGVGPGISGGPASDDGPYTLYRATEAGITHITKPDGSRLENTNTPRALGNKILFHLRGDGQNALWATDGTPDGAKELIGADADLPLGGFNDADRVSGDHLYTVRGGREIWRTDGTSAGTARFGAIPKALEPSELAGFTALGGKVWFSAFTAPHRTELWRADGTPTGTALAFDLNTRPIGASIGRAVRLGDHAYFQASDGSLHPQLWRSDGTEAGTTAVTSFPSPGGRFGASYLRELTPAGNALYVISDLDMASSLWKVTPSGDKTALLASGDLAGGGTRIGSVTTWQGGIAFVASRTPGRRPTIWTSDGTVAGTRPLPGEPDASIGSALRAIGGVLYYGTPGPNGDQLTRTDGTTSGTAVLTTLPGTGSSLITAITSGLGGAPWFVRQESYGTPSGLYRADAGAPTGATRLAQASQIGEPRTTFGGRVFFDAYSDASQQTGLWSSDGTAAGTRLEEAGARDAQIIGTSLTFIRASGAWPDAQSSLWTTKSTLAAATRIDAGPGEVDRPFEVAGHLLFARSTEALSWQLFGVAIDADQPLAPETATPVPTPTATPEATPATKPPGSATPTPTPRAEPGIGVPASIVPGGIAWRAAVARDRSAPYRFSFTGELKAIASSTISPAQCAGSVRITILRGSKTVATKDTAVAPSPAGRCIFNLDVAVPRGKLTRRGSLKAKVAFAGAGQLAPFRAPGHVKLRYG